jgi:hypothetical protein
MLREALMLVRREWMLLALLLTAPMTAAAGNAITEPDEKAVSILQTGTEPPQKIGTYVVTSVMQPAQTAMAR